MGQRGKSEFNEVALPLLGFSRDYATLHFSGVRRLRKIMRITGWKIDSPQIVFLTGIAMSTSMRCFAADQYAVRRIELVHKIACEKRARVLEDAAYEYACEFFEDYWLKELRTALFWRLQNWTEQKLFDAILVSLKWNLPEPK
ncbi:MAG: hypothetical protein FJ044_04750 [Candidatus Cloacimonetes bacterium]|nr:hypothetical protein [Candidatus Cloacimonadota bacterium]